MYGEDVSAVNERHVNSIVALTRLMRGFVSIFHYSAIVMCVCVLRKYGYLDRKKPAERLTDLIKRNRDLPYADDLLDITRYYIPKPVDVNLNQSGVLYANLADIDEEVFGERFHTIFDGVMRHISESYGKSTGRYLSRQAVTEIITSLLEWGKGSRVYNPFAGPASYAIPGRDTDYLGQEVDKSVYQFGRLRLIAHGLLDRPNINYEINNSVDSWPTDERFDIIVGVPPFGAVRGGEFEFETGIRRYH